MRYDLPHGKPRPMGFRDGKGCCVVPLTLREVSLLLGEVCVSDAFQTVFLRLGQFHTPRKIGYRFELMA